MNFLEAIAQSIIHILWQSIIIYCILMVVILLFKNQHKKIYYAALIAQFTMFAVFMFNIFYFLNNDSTKHVINDNFNTLLNYWYPYISFIYFIFLIITLLITYKDQSSIGKTIKDASNIIDEKWIYYIQSKKKELHIFQSVRLMIGSKYPFIFTKYFWKPIIYIPLSVITNMSAEQIETLLLHELMHIKNKDYLLNLLQLTIEKILYFNIIVKITGDIARQKREIICDAQVTKLSNKFSYSEALLQLSKQSKINKVSLISASGNSQNELLNRIKIIHQIDVEHPIWNFKKLLLSLIIAFILFPLSQNKKIVNIEHNQHTAIINNAKQNLLIEEEISLPSITTTRNDILIKNHPAKNVESNSNSKSEPDKMTTLSIEKHKIIKDKSIEEIKKNSDINYTPSSSSSSSINIQLANFRENNCYEFTVKNDSKEFEEVIMQLNNLLKNESIQYQSYQISQVQTLVGIEKSTYNYFKTENYTVEVFNNANYTRINLSKHSPEKVIDNIN